MILYHLTKIYNDKYWKVYPKFVKSSQFEYVNAVRFCVAPTIEGCLKALDWGDYKSDEYYVYQVNAPKTHFIDNETLNKTRHIFDSHITGECWIVKPVTFKFLYKIKVDYLDEYDHFEPLRSVRIKRNGRKKFKRNVKSDLQKFNYNIIRN